MAAVKPLHVVKRDGSLQSVRFDKITSRMSKLCYGLSLDHIDPALITVKVINSLFPGISTAALDDLAAEVAASMAIHHPDYGTLASRIAVSNLHKQTEKSFSKLVDRLFHGQVDGVRMRVISEHVHRIVMNNAEALNAAIVHDRDYMFTYFGLKQLEQHLIHLDGRPVERPQHMMMRVAVTIHRDDIDAAIEAYQLMSEHWFLFSTTTMYNAGSCDNQLVGSFLVTMAEDSLRGIYDTLSRCAHIYRGSGDIGLNIHCVRGTGSLIASTNGESTGIVPMLRVYNSSLKYSQQISKKRFGAIAVYLEPWHRDVFEFVELRRGYGAEELRARDLYCVLWVPDLFMERVEANLSWTLMCPRDCPGLVEACGNEFRELYERYEAEGRGRKTVSAQKLWYAIIESQIETGSPAIVYKDACNRKSNHGKTLKCLGLHAGLAQYTSPEEVGACPVASLNLKKFVIDGYFCFGRLEQVIAVIVKSLNRLIDVSDYPVPEARLSAEKHRAIAVSVEGLADAFALLGYEYESEQAKQLNRDIFECIYYAALKASCRLAMEEGAYATFCNSPAAKNIFQLDMWDERETSTKWDWEGLKQAVERHGLRNSVVVAVTPSSASAILDVSSTVDPFVSVLRTGHMNSVQEFYHVNDKLARDLMKRGCWTEHVREAIVSYNGSIQAIEEIPEDLRRIYKTAWEIPQRAVVDMAVDRGAFIDQSQSLNIHMVDPNYPKVSSMHFYGWKKGLKTGMYCLNTRHSSGTAQSCLSTMLGNTLRINS